MSVKARRGRIDLRELVLLALLSALMFGTKVALAAIPNVHLNAVFILLAVLLFGSRAFYAVFVYVLLEGVVYGFGLWFVSYLYAWPLLVLAALPLRENRSWLLWAVLAAVHGLLFGALCAIPYFFVLSAKEAIAWWISGLPFDCIHAAANFVIVLTLLKPLYRVSLKALGRPREA